MKSTIKIARLDNYGDPIYDCHVFAVDDAEIKGDVKITGDFIGGDNICINGRIIADGIVCIGNCCEAKDDVFAGEGIFAGDDLDSLDLVSPDDIEVGRDADIRDISSYGNVKIGYCADMGNIDVFNGGLVVKSVKRCRTIRAGKE